MSLDYKLDEYRTWLKENVTLSDPFSPIALRKLTYHLLMGKNYRLLTESNTKGRLFTTFLWLSQIQKEAKKEYGENWITQLFDETYSQERSPKELKDLLFWIMGITRKTAVNPGLKKEDYPDFMKETVSFFNELFDILGTKTRVHHTAENSGVKLIQIRHCNPLLDVHRHLKQLVRIDLNEVPQTSEAIKAAVDLLPDPIFCIDATIS